MYPQTTREASAQIPTRLYPIDSFPLTVLCADTNNLYGFYGGGAQLSTSNEDGSVITDGVSVFTLKDAAGTVLTSPYIYNAWSTADNVVFVEIGTPSVLYFLYKSIDRGVNYGNNSPTFDNLLPVAELGRLGGTHATSISILNRGFLKATDGTLYYAEYNTNGARVNGGANDWVRLFKSTDQGTTWTVAQTWNTSGHQVRHLHAVRQDPYTGDIYVGVGDSATEGGIIKWDGVTAWTNNTTLGTIKVTPGFNCLVAATVDEGTIHICTDLIFTEDWIYNPADSGTNEITSRRGLFRFDRAMTLYQLVDNQLVTNANHVGYWGLKSSGGTFIYCELVEPSATDRNMYLYSSANGKRWYRSGVIRPSSGTSGNLTPASFFEWKNKIYIGLGGNFSQKVLASPVVRGVSVVFNPIGDFIEDEAEVLHPVYWVATNGVDDAAAYRGYRPSTPWVSPGYGLAANNMTYGGRLIIGAGTYNSLQIDPTFNAHLPYPGVSGVPVVIEGVGRTATLIIGLASNTYTLYFRNASQINLVKDLTLDLARTDSTGNLLNQEATYAGTCEFRRCTIGNKSRILGATARADYGSFIFNRSLIAAGNNALVRIANAANVTLNSCLLDGGSNVIYYAGNSLVMNNNTLINYISGLVAVNGSVNQPTGKNNLFYAPSADYPIKDFRTAPFLWNDGSFDFNCLDKVTTPVVCATGGPHNKLLVTNPLFTNFAGGDYTLSVNSAAYKTGVYIGVRNFNSIIQSTNDRVNIGAF